MKRVLFLLLIGYQVAAQTPKKISEYPAATSLTGTEETIIVQGGANKKASINLWANLFPSLTGSYANPSWITSLGWSKITGAPSFLTSETGTNLYLLKGKTILPDTVSVEFEASITDTETYTGHYLFSPYENTITHTSDINTGEELTVSNTSHYWSVSNQNDHYVRFYHPFDGNYFRVNAPSILMDHGSATLFRFNGHTYMNSGAKMYVGSPFYYMAFGGFRRFVEGDFWEGSAFNEISVSENNFRFSNVDESKLRINFQHNYGDPLYAPAWGRAAIDIDSEGFAKRRAKFTFRDLGDSGDFTSIDTVYFSVGHDGLTIPVVAAPTGEVRKLVIDDAGAVTSVVDSGGGSVTSVGITPPAAGITVSGSPVTSSGSITLALADDLAAIEGLSTTGIVKRTASNTWSTGTVSLSSEVSGDLPFSNLTQGSALSVLGVTGNATADVASIAAGTDGHVLRRSGTTLGFGTLASGAFASNTVSRAALTNGTALTVIGRSANSTGAVADIAAGTDHNILRRSGTTLGFGAVDLSQAGAVGSSILPVVNGGTGTATPNLIAGTNINITGSWPNQTINSSGIGGSTGGSDNAILRADGTGGGTLQSSPAFITDAGFLQLGANSLSGGSRAIEVLSSESNADLNLITKGNGSLIFKSSTLGSRVTTSLYDGLISIGNGNSSGTYANSSVLQLYKQRGLIGTPSVVQNGDILGALSYTGYDGAGGLDGAKIQGVVSGTPGVGVMPIDVVFYGGNGGNVETFRVTNGGQVIAKNYIARFDTKTETGTSYTLTANDEGLTIRFTNSGTVTVTLPDALPQYFRCAIENLGTGTVVLSAETTLNSAGTTVTNQYTGCYVEKLASNVWLALGALN